LIKKGIKMPPSLFSEKKKWSSPGSLIFTGERKVENLKLSLISYDDQHYSSVDVESLDQFPELIQNGKVNWINITGLHDTLKLDALGKLFNIHPLVIEDILNTSHSPKFENYVDYIFIIAKMIDLNPDKNINIEQVSFILGENYLITFQEDEEDVFNVIRDRIKSNVGRIRFHSTDYLLYRLLDAIVDNYFVVLENIEDKIEILDDQIISEKSRASLNQLYDFRKELMKLRRAVFPLQETIHAFLRERDNFITEAAFPFYRDLSDHVKYIYDSIENYREMTTSLLDVYMSSESHRLNEVIKVLTIISTIFIPLTFIVGIYGMNFNTELSRWNMPELNWIYGYPFVWGVMLFITALLVLFFKRKKWF
jgi:magnesium transporter